MRIFRTAFSTSALFAVVASPATIASAQNVHRAAVDIVAGPTVHVSADRPSEPFYEPWAAGDLVHQGRATSCSTIHRETINRFIDQECYVTFDGGKTWKESLYLQHSGGNQDPAVTYGLNNDVYVVSLVEDHKDQIEPADPNAPPQHNSCTEVWKSVDGGRTYNEHSCSDDIDRENIVVDLTHGRYRGNIYISGQGGIETIDGSEGASSISVWRSVDGGKTWLGPAQAAYPQGSIIFGVGSSAVLSDGTYVTMFGLTLPGENQNMNLRRTPNAELRVITSRDGGRTLDASHKIADVILDRPRSEGGILNEMAVDPGSKYFKDRIYTAFPEIVDNRIQIGFSYSGDEGKTWSTPIIVNDDRSPEKGGRGPDHLLPGVAVNKDGVVLVTWYDRRNAKRNLGWQMRAAASLDGGQTFSASVPITKNVDTYTARTPWDFFGFGDHDRAHSTVSLEFGIDPFFTSAGHTTGMAADAEGTFFPTWIDNSSGVAQLYAAPIRVNGVVTKNGDPSLARLADVSKYIAVELSHASFNRATGDLSFDAQLKNVSHRAIRGPFKFRVLNLESGLGVPMITNATNGASGTGAIWDFSSVVSGGKLASLQLSRPKRLRFHLDGIRSLRPGHDLNLDLFNLDGRMFATDP